ncbi:MAG: hypothetical protein R3C13_03660 [Hyphomonas sp.]|uniref:hypothetical protein n=1 Tax=Hyphomonas sp. TaxID=87 RepID=UPI0035291C29
MKASRLVQLLDPTTQLLGWGENQQAVERIKELATELNKRSSLNLFVFFSMWQVPMGSASNDNHTLGDLLRSIMGLQKASGASKKSITQLSDLIDVIPVDASAPEVARAIGGFDLVEAFIAGLQDAAGSREKFEKIMKLLETKGVATKAQLCEIAQQYAGGTKPKSGPFALSAIRAKFSSDQLFASKTG